jgi:alpha-L-rhamnosidase
MKQQHPLTPATFHILCLALVSLLLCPSLLASPVQLRCNYQTNPLGIDTPQPHLSWQSDNTQRNWQQSAYQIFVATRPELAAAGKADVWDSGRQNSAASVDIPYAGPALDSRQRYFWSVTVWDAQGHSYPTLHPAWWEMGLLHQSDWSATWINSADHSRELAAGLHWVWLGHTDALHAAPHTTATFRRVLDLQQLPLRASLAVVARGEISVSVNGQLVDHKKGWASFDSTDLTGAFHLGSNEVQIVVTTLAPSKTFAGLKGSTAETVPAGFAARLSLTSPGGALQTLNAGDDWEGTAGSPSDTQDGKQASWAPAAVVADLNDPRMGDDPGLPLQPATLLRNDFQLAKPIREARLYVTAAGSYRMSIDGHRVGETDLTPDFTDYRVRFAYQTYDVTALLHPGSNTLGAILGDGWFASPMTWMGSRVFPGPRALLAQLEIVFTDGSRQTISTSPNWKTSTSPILSSEIYAGEHYDARLEQPGWDTPAFHAAAWSSAAVEPAPAAAVSAQIDSPVHQTGTVHPIHLQKLANGDWVFDMGQNMVGWTTLHVLGPAGATVKLRFAERLLPDGSIYTENLRNAEATDVYTLRGGGPETFTPHFTYHGFRYVQVSGLPNAPTLATLTGDVLNSLDSNPTGRLETSSTILNRMWSLGIWGQRGNFVSIPSDCPQRDERLGWTGDAGVFWRTGSYNFDTAAFSAKYTQDLVDAQTAEGAFPDVAPNLLHNIGAPGWGDAGVIVPYTAWLQYGDRSLIDQHWQAMQHWMDFIASSNPNYLREKNVGSNYSDWLAPDPHSSSTLVDTAYWAILAHMMQQMAVATGRDPAPYAELYDHIRSAYQKAYLAADGTVTPATQTDDLLTLYAGLAPDSLRSTIADHLVADIHAHQNHLTTGFLGTPFLLFVLSDNGHTDTAYDLLLQQTYPSWGYMVSKGATTWWERWNGDTGDPSMNSYNHYSFGSVMAWVYRDTVGIDTSLTAPGFQHLLLHPHFTPQLSFAHGEYDSVYGRIVSSWRRTPAGTIAWTITLPANTSASVTLEDKSGTTHVVEVGSGTYRFLDGRELPN